MTKIGNVLSVGTFLMSMEQSNWDVSVFANDIILKSLDLESAEMPSRPSISSRILTSSNVAFLVTDERFEVSVRMVQRIRFRTFSS